MSKHHVLSFKPQLRLEWRGQHRQNETEQPRSFRQLRRFHHAINSNKVFGTHSRPQPRSVVPCASGRERSPVASLRIGLNADRARCACAPQSRLDRQRMADPGASRKPNAHCRTVRRTSRRGRRVLRHLDLSQR
jgi:hypothetical protein